MVVILENLEVTLDLVGLVVELEVGMLLVLEVLEVLDILLVKLVEMGMMVEEEVGLLRMLVLNLQAILVVLVLLGQAI